MKKRYFLLALMAASLLGTQAAERTLRQKQLAAAAALASQGGMKKAPAASEMLELKVMPALTVMGSHQGGFAVIANDDANEAVLGYSTSPYDSTMPDGFTWWLNAANEALANGTVKKAVRVSGNYKTEMEPIMLTKWGQGEPYNLLCYKKYPSGCVATAMAQVMYFHKYPTTGEGEEISIDNFEIVDFAEGTYDYDNMLLEYKKGEYNKTQGDAVAKLMYHCGIAVFMQYNATGSGSHYILAANALRKNFKYNTNLHNVRREYYTAEEWNDMLYGELNAGRPLLYSGSDIDKSAGHAFVFDGYNAEGLVHVNWGWDGSKDGYYDMNILQPNGSEEKYSSYQNMIVGFALPDENVPEHSDLYFTKTPDVSATSNTLVFKVSQSSPIMNYNDYDFMGTVTAHWTRPDGTTYDDTFINIDNEDDAVHAMPYYSPNLNLGYLYNDSKRSTLSNAANGTYKLTVTTKYVNSDNEFPVRAAGGVTSYTIVKNGSRVTVTKDTPTGIDRQVTVSQPAADEYTTVYNAQGEQLYRCKTANFRLSDVNAKGLLIVKSGSTVKKVVNE